MPSEFAVQFMQLPSRQIHVLWAYRRIQAAELQPEALCVVWLNTGFGSAPKKLLDAFVAKIFDHDFSFLFLF
jgi:hypothetical protein